MLSGILCGLIQKIPHLVDIVLRLLDLCKKVINLLFEFAGLELFVLDFLVFSVEMVIFGL